MEIVIPPLTWSWSEWPPRVRAMQQTFTAICAEHGPVAAAKFLGDWERSTDAWLRTFDSQKRRSLVDLLLAEQALLFETIDPSHGPKPAHGSDAFTDFRDRFYEARPLALAAERCGFDAAFAVREYRSLETFAERRGWLP